jgi:hypothetical protein
MCSVLFAENVVFIVQISQHSADFACNPLLILWLCQKLLVRAVIPKEETTNGHQLFIVGATFSISFDRPNYFL